MQDLWGPFSWVGSPKLWGCLHFAFTGTAFWKLPPDGCIEKLRLGSWGMGTRVILNGDLSLRLKDFMGATLDNGQSHQN